MLATNNSHQPLEFPLDEVSAVVPKPQSRPATVNTIHANSSVTITPFVVVPESGGAVLPVVDIRTSPYDYLKRMFDVIGATLLLTALSPLMLLIAIAIKLTSRGPVIFKQNRLTAGGRIFTMYKFRTMLLDAESKTGPIWASCSDPRITNLGRLLRIARLDELPQLINVICGEMSLIGPRPERPEIAIKLMREFPNFSRRLEVKGGITGLAQIASGYASSVRGYRRKLALDIKYIDNRCLLLDARIACKTIVVVLTGAGAR